MKSSTWWAFLVVALAIGCVADADSMVEDVSLGYLYMSPDDIIVWYTDGLTEASDRDAKGFGTVRLLESVRLHSGGSARELCEQLWLAAAAFTQSDSLTDDLTLMVIKMKSAPEPIIFPAFSD